MRHAVLASTAVLILAGYASTLRGMFEQWWNDEDVSHGLVVPVVVAWVVWRERARWSALPVKPSYWGFAVLALGAGMQYAAALGGGLFAASLAFLFSITGAVLCLGGVGFLRSWTFPLLLALFMLPKLAMVYSQVTLPLQLLASQIGAGILTFAGVAVIREGNILDVAGHRVSVEEACNGIRYLLSLGFVAVVFAYFFDPKPWMRLALLAAAIPIAIFGNAVRVAVAGLLPALDAGTLHTAAGGFVFVLCLALLVLARRLFHEVYVRHNV